MGFRGRVSVAVSCGRYQAHASDAILWCSQLEQISERYARPVLNRVPAVGAVEGCGSFRHRHRKNVWIRQRERSLDCAPYREPPANGIDLGRRLSGDRERVSGKQPESPRSCCRVAWPAWRRLSFGDQISNSPTYNAHTAEGQHSEHRATRRKVLNSSRRPMPPRVEEKQRDDAQTQYPMPGQHGLRKNRLVRTPPPGPHQTQNHDHEHQDRQDH